MKFNSSKHHGSSIKETATATGMTETVTLNTVERLTVEIYSKNDDALNKKERFFTALKSNYTRYICEKYGVGIFPIGEFQDLSQGYGAAVVHRFDMPVVVQAPYETTRSIDYFDAVPLEVRTEDWIKTIDTTKLPQEEG